MRTNKIHLLHLVQGLKVGGAEVLLLHYIKALGIDNYLHYIYCFGNNGHIRKKLEDLGVPVVFGPKRKSIINPVKFSISIMFLFKDLLRFIKKQDIQIIQSHLGHANHLGVAVAMLANIPAFPTVHSTMAFIDRRRYWDPRIYFYRALNNIVYRSAVKIIAVSQEVKEIIRKEYRLSESNVVVLKNGIIFENSDKIPANIKFEFKLSRNCQVLIGVGSLTYQKGFEVLIRAVDELVKQGFDNLFVLIAGEGVERDHLEDLIKSLSLSTYIKLTGLRHDIIELMQASDIFVMPSRYEGLSIAMIEAMACALPIVASDAPGLSDYIIYNQNGFLFPIGDHQEMALCIYKLLQDNELKNRLAKGSRESFENEYDMSRNIKSVNILFHKFKQ